MKKVRIWLRMIVCVLFMLSAVVFASIEGLLLFSDDWKLFENDRLAFVQLIAKILLCLYCFTINLRATLKRKQSDLWSGIQLLGVTLAAAPFLSNHLGVPFAVLAVLFLISEPCVWDFLFDRTSK